MLVTGAGPIGILAAAIAKFSGARHVVITDLNEYRLELARQFGVMAVNTKETDLKEVMADLGIHEGFDVGMEMSGNPIALRQLIESMYNGGRIALLGLPNKNAVELPLNTIIWNGLILKGIYGREMYETWYKMQAMVEAGFPLEKSSPTGSLSRITSRALKPCAPATPARSFWIGPDFKTNLRKDAVS